MVELITDRTQFHVDRLKALLAKGYLNFSASERSEWAGDAQKGAYNHTDLNRVESAVAELASDLMLNLETKTNWTKWDIPTQMEMNRYLGNVRKIRVALGGAVEGTSGVLGDFTLGTDTLGGSVARATTTEGDTILPPIPRTMSGLTYEDANNIERCLTVAHELIESAPRCGEVFCGEVN